MTSDYQVPAGRAARVTRLVDTLELSPEILALNDAREREAVALADGLVDLAEAFEQFVAKNLPRLEAQTTQAGVEDALAEALADLREVIWHVWYSKYLRRHLLGVDLDVPWIDRSLRP